VLSGLDDSIQTWFYNGVPSLENQPAVEWDDEKKAEHIGDIYFDEGTGYIYLFKYTDGVYSWVSIATGGASEGELEQINAAIISINERLAALEEVSGEQFGICRPLKTDVSINPVVTATIEKG
jgi:phage-related protein